MFARNPASPCPLCRQPTAHFYATLFRDAAGFVMVSDCGAALRGTFGTETIVSEWMPATNRSAWLNMKTCLGVRLGEGVDFLYAAQGEVTDTFVELFAAVPRFAGMHDGERGRQSRADRRDLVRSVVTFMTVAGNEDVLAFLRWTVFPVEIWHEEV